MGKRMMADCLREDAARVFEAGGGPDGRIYLATDADFGISATSCRGLDRILCGPLFVDDSKKTGHIHRCFALLLAACVAEDGGFSS